MSRLVIRTFFATVASNMPHGAGYWEIQATDLDHARELANEKTPGGRWCFLYESLEKVHPLDRKRHGVIS